MRVDEQLEQEVTASPPSLLFHLRDGGGSAARLDRGHDFEELMAAAKDELQRLRKSESKLSRRELAGAAGRIWATEQGQPSFAERLENFFRYAGLPPPSVEIEYRDLTVTTAARVGDSANPTVWNWLLALVKRLALQGGLHTTPLQILSGVNGVIKPGRLTLLLGPPGSGKSVFLQVLSGRLTPSASTQIDGSIKYNGRAGSEFSLRGTVGLVDQHDHHIPSLTVEETLRFAGACLMGQRNALGTTALVQAAQQRAAREGAAGAALASVEAGAGAAGGANEGAASGGRGSEPPSGKASDDGGGGESHGASAGTSAAADKARGQPYYDADLIDAIKKLVVNQLRPYLALHLLGLAHVAATPVGSAMVRGVSGGERKRVTSGEVLSGPQAVLLMDEISTGLDSATTYSVVKSLSELCHATSLAVVVSLLQPPPEVLYLFDDLLLLAEGRVLFHGPVAEALPFFAGLGLQCPPRKDPGSFLQEVTTPVGQLAYATPALLAARAMPESLRDPAALATKLPTDLLVSLESIAGAFWQDSAPGRAMRDQLDQRPFDPARGRPDALVQQRYAHRRVWLTWLVLRRQLLLMRRDAAFYVGKVLQATVMALIIGSLFSGIDDTVSDGRKVLSISALSIIFLSVMSIPQLAVVYSTKRVFYKQRDNNFFPAASYVLGLALTQLPQSLAETSLFVLIIWFIAGFGSGVGTFWVYLLVAFSTSNCLGALLRLISFWASQMVIGQAVAGIALMFMVICNGFSILRTSLPSYAIWIYYINPNAWGLMGLGINALTSPKWDAPVSSAPGAPTTGVAVLEAFGFYTDRVWIWAAVGFQWAMALLYSLAGVLALMWTDPPHPRPSVALEDQKAALERDAIDSITRSLSATAKRSSARAAAVGGAVGGGAEAVEPSGGGAEAVEPSGGGAEAVEPSGGGAEAVEPSGDGGKAVEPSGDGAEVLKHSLVPGRLLRLLRRAAKQASAKQGPSKADGAGEDGPAAPTVAFTPITLVCRDIKYYVTDPSKGAAPGVVPQGDADRETAGKLQLLKGISMYAEPGSLTALMGGSGAGKTTLMDVVAGRKTQGLVRGDILVNSLPKDQASWSRVVGYVEQQDIHSPGLTVRESLLFSARLRLPETITDEQASAIVQGTVDRVELGSVAGLVVGEPGGSGLSTEQFKRLSIAVELVANPSVIFLDEPTSGLDARAAAIVMRAIRAVGDAQKTVVVTIHQPSMEIFEAFDMLVLLQRGGRLTYFGPLGLESSELVSYLTAVPDVAPLRPGYNPATWMLEVTGGSTSTLFQAAGHDFPQIYEESTLRRANEARMDALAAAGADGSAPLAVEGTYATRLATQFRWCSWKYVRCYWRTPYYNFVRLAMTILAALVYGAVYWGQGRLSSDTTSQQTVQNIMGLIFSMTVFLGMFNCMTVMPIVAGERLVYYRERAASMYAPRAHLYGLLVAEAPYLAAQAAVMICISYWMVGFQIVAWKFFYFILMFLLSLSFYTFFGTTLVYLTPNQLLAQLLASFCNSLFTYLSGFMLPAPQIPAGWYWANRITPPTYILWGLVASQLGDRTQLLEYNGQVLTVGEYIDVYFGYSYDMVWPCVAIVAGFAIFFRVASLALLRFVNFQRR